MAYRYEKEPNGDSALVIDGWDSGIASDPYSGFGMMQQVDLETPGEVSVGYPLTALATSGATLSQPIARSTRYFPTYITRGVSNGNEQSYAILDSSGHVFEVSAFDFTSTWAYLASSSSLTNASAGDGIAYWLGYLFKFRDSNIDYWNGSAWTNGWKTSSDGIATGVKHFMYVASNNQLYFTNGNYIGRIFAPDPDTFAPGTAASYDFNATILRLPTNDVALSLCEVGGGNSPQSTLLIGGALNAVYPWDKLSPSFSLPIYVAESYITRMVSANQNAFIFPGKLSGRGNIYITNGSQADLYYKIPDYLFGQQDPFYVWGDAIFHRNNIIFGVVPITNSGGTNPANGNIFALSLEKKVFRSVTYQTTSTGTVNLGALIPIISPQGIPNRGNGFGYVAGYSNDSGTSALAYSGTGAGVASSNTVIYSDLINIGSFLQKKTFSQIEFKLRTPLLSGESISITPILDSVSGTALTFSPTVTTGSLSGVAPVTFQSNQWLQLQISIVGNSVSGGGRLREVRIR